MQRHKLGEMPIFKEIKGMLIVLIMLIAHRQSLSKTVEYAFFTREWNHLEKKVLCKRKIHKTLLKVINKILWNVNKLISKKMFTDFNNISGTHCY